jgi:proteasome lid subunit RPN8/RPN11
MQYEFYLLEDAYNKGLTHATQSGAKNLESLGLLTGKVNTFNGVQYATATDYITADNDSTNVSVRFGPEAFAELARKFSGKNGELIIGWMHSHPSYGCFLSQTDVKTQRTYFAEPFNVAVVVDPVEAARTKANAVRAYRLDNSSANGYREISFAIIRRKGNSQINEFVRG